MWAMISGPLFAPCYWKAQIGGRLLLLTRLVLTSACLKCTVLVFFVVAVGRVRSLSPVCGMTWTRVSSGGVERVVYNVL